MRKKCRIPRPHLAVTYSVVDTCMEKGSEGLSSPPLNPMGIIYTTTTYSHLQENSKLAFANSHVLQEASQYKPPFTSTARDA